MNVAYSLMCLDFSLSNYPNNILYFSVKVFPILLLFTHSLNPRDGGAWWAAVYGVTQSDMTEASQQQQAFYTVTVVPNGMCVDVCAYAYSLLLLTQKCNQTFMLNLYPTLLLKSVFRYSNLLTGCLDYLHAESCE